jgi:serine/threonine-protein kinase RsbW
MNGFKKEKTKNGFDAVFSSTWENVENCVKEAVEFIKNNPSKIDLFAFRLCLYEILSNAAKHGNKLAPEKNISFKLQLNTNSLNIQIEDEGDGFDWKTALEKQATVVDYETPSGRGLMLLKAYGYLPEYNEKGNVLAIEKKLE